MFLPRRKWFDAKTAYIASPSVIDITVRLGFGVVTTRRFSISGLIPIPPESEAEAKHCLVVLCGGKDLLIETDTELYGDRLYATILAPAVDPPKQFTHVVDGNVFVDVGPYMSSLADVNFPIDMVRTHLNGKHRARKVQRGAVSE